MKHKKCVQCGKEMEEGYDTGKNIQFGKILSQEDINIMTLEGRILVNYKVGDFIIEGITTEKIPYCNEPECPNYKLLQIGE